MHNKKVVLIVLCLLLFFSSLPNSGNVKAEKSKQSMTEATITVSGLRIRKGPGTEFQIIGSLNKGQAVELLKMTDQWAEIHTEGIQGWVASEFVQEKNSLKNNGAPKSGIVTADALNVRETPSLTARSLGKLAKGAQVPIHSQNNGWTEITYLEKRAWISSQFLQIKEMPSGSSGKPSGQASQMTAKVTASQLKIREHNALDAKVIGTVSKGQTFQILDEQNNWIKIEFKRGEIGWAAGWFFEKTKSGPTVPSSQSVKNSSVKILHNGTNIRKGPGTGTSVIYRANQGDSFSVLSVKNDWYELKLPNGLTGYVAGWIVSIHGNGPQIEKPGAEIHTKNRTVVIDPGHGGRDNGTTGVRGTLEKTLTLKTAQLLYAKLKASGTTVIMTRNNDSYLSLGSRVSTSHYHNADAFISIHYDSINDRSVRGMTSYYYNSKQKPLSEQIHASVISKTMLKDRGARAGDYHVLRENRQNSVLLELGYLSNPAEEMLVSTAHYQETVANGIFDGLARYFKNK